MIEKFSGAVAVSVAALMIVIASAALAEPQPLGSPIRLALDPAGIIAVSEGTQSRVSLLDRTSLRTIETISVGGRPLGVAFDGDRLLVGNDTTGNVDIYGRNRKGAWKLRGRLGGRKYKGLVPNPAAIAVDAQSGLVFAISGAEQTVKVFSATREPPRIIAGPGDGPAALVAPTGIALDRAARRVLVSDHGNSHDSSSTYVPARVQIYDYAGTYLETISGNPRSDGFKFFRPQGLAADKSGRIFLTASLRGEILVFENDGTQWAGVAVIGQSGRGPGELLLPMDVAIEPGTLDLLVTNNRNARLEVFPGGGALP